MIVARVNVDKGIGGNQARHFHLSCSSWFLLSLSVPFVFLWVFIIRSTSLFVFSTAINTRRKREREREREREQERIAPRRRYQPPQVKEKKSRFFFFGGVVFFFFFFFFFSFFFFLNLFFVSSFPFFIFASVRTTTCKEAREATIKFNEVRFEKINWKKRDAVQSMRRASSIKRRGRQGNGKKILIYSPPLLSAKSRPCVATLDLPRFIDSSIWNRKKRGNWHVTNRRRHRKRTRFFSTWNVKKNDGEAFYITRWTRRIHRLSLIGNCWH